MNITLEKGRINDNSRLELILKSSSSLVGQYRTLNSYPGENWGNANNYASGICTGIFYLLAGETVRPKLYHNLGRTKYLRADKSYNSITIYGL